MSSLWILAGQSDLLETQKTSHVFVVSCTDQKDSMPANSFN